MFSDIEGKKFLLGDHVTLADIFVFSDLLNLTELAKFEIEGDNLKMFMNQMKGIGYLSIKFIYILILLVYKYYY